MNINRNLLISIGAIIFGAILFNWGLHNPTPVAQVANAAADLLMPFIFGSALAFIVNIPMQVIEQHLPTMPKLAKLRRPLAWLLTLLLLSFAIGMVVNIVIPQLIDTLQTVSARAMQIFRSTDDLSAILPPYITALIPELEQTMRDLGLNISSFSDKLAEMLQNLTLLFHTGFNLVNSIISTLVTVFVGFFFSVYLLFDKETLVRQGKQVIFALFKQPTADKIISVLRLSCQTFKNFITGQCIEACVLALLFFCTMFVLRLPYATLISTVIGITALIPVFGAFIGCIFGCLLLLLNNPLQIIEFLILFLVLQQIEGNLIYPRVVGGKVGLPAIWVLAAITLGGGLFGVLGMLVFIPLCSVAYALFAEYIKNRLQARKIPPEKWQ